MKALLHESLRAGRLPLWSPYIFCGYPIAAEGQIAAFYPPGLLISWLLPSPAAINWLLISHLMLAAVSMYLLVRALRISPLGAWLSALTFSFSGYLFAHLHHVSLICAAAWLPLALLLVERAWQGRSLAYGPLAAIAWAASALCGHPQTLFHISLALISCLIWRAAGASGTGARGVWRKASALCTLVFALGCGFASVQLLLTADLSRLAPHGEKGTLAYVTSFSLLPKHLIGLIAPNWQGTIAFNTYRGEPYYWEYALYIGIVPLALALIGAVSRKGRLWAGFAVIALALALAQGNPLYHLLRFVPGFSEFRAPARYVFLFTFAAAVLTGLGWETIARSRTIAKGRRALLAGLLIAAAAAADLLWFDRTLAPLAGSEVYQATPRIVQALKDDPTWGRALIVPPIQLFADWSPPGGWAGNPDGWLEARVYLPASVPQSFDLPIVGGYAGFVDQRHALFFEEASRRTFGSADVSLYSLVGTRRFVLGPNLPLAGLPETEIAPFHVHVNEDAFPRAFTIGQVLIARDDQDARRITFDLADRGELRKAAAVSGQVGAVAGAGLGGQILNIREPRPERVLVRARSPNEHLVVLNERWDPGWTARVDGRPVRLLEVDGVLMGAWTPGGEHTVEFHYRPRALVIGRALSLACLGICGLFLVLAGTRRRRPLEQ